MTEFICTLLYIPLYLFCGFGTRYFHQKLICPIDPNGPFKRKDHEVIGLWPMYWCCALIALVIASIAHIKDNIMEKIK